MSGPSLCLLRNRIYPYRRISFLSPFLFDPVLYHQTLGRITHNAPNSTTQSSENLEIPSLPKDGNVVPNPAAKRITGFSKLPLWITFNELITLILSGVAAKSPIR